MTIWPQGPNNLPPEGNTNSQDITILRILKFQVCHSNSKTDYDKIKKMVASVEFKHYPLPAL